MILELDYFIVDFIRSTGTVLASISQVLCPLLASMLIISRLVYRL
jgi:hypothetical protein